MDPISAILAALAAGAAAAAKDTASTALKDAYEGLKSLVKKKLASSGSAEAVDAHASDPEAAEAELRAALKEVEVDRDDKVVENARSVLEMAQREGIVMKQTTITIHGNAQGVIHGDNAHDIHMNFGSEPAKKG